VLGQTVKELLKKTEDIFMSDQEALVGIRLVMKAQLPVTYTADVTVPLKNLDDINECGIRYLIESLMDEKVPKISMGQPEPLGVEVEFVSVDSVEKLVKEEDWWPTHQWFKTREGKWQLEETPTTTMVIREERL
jgi:hypothetical protein